MKKSCVVGAVAVSGMIMAWAQGSPFSATTSASFSVDMALGATNAVGSNTHRRAPGFMYRTESVYGGTPELTPEEAPKWGVSFALGNNGGIAHATFGGEGAEAAIEGTSVGLSLGTSSSDGGWEFGAEVSFQQGSGSLVDPIDSQGIEYEWDGWTVGPYVKGRVPIIGGFTPISAYMKAGVNIDSEEKKVEVDASGETTTSHADYITFTMGMGVEAASSTGTVFAEIEEVYGGGRSFDGGITDAFEINETQGEQLNVRAGMKFKF